MDWIWGDRVRAQRWLTLQGLFLLTWSVCSVHTCNSTQLSEYMQSYKEETEETPGLLYFF